MKLIIVWNISNLFLRLFVCQNTFYRIFISTGGQWPKKTLEEARQKYEWKACEKDLFRKEDEFFLKEFQRHDYYYEKKISGIMKEKKKERKTNRERDKKKLWKKLRQK